MFDPNPAPGQVWQTKAGYTVLLVHSYDQQYWRTINLSVLDRHALPLCVTDLASFVRYVDLEPEPAKPQPRLHMKQVDISAFGKTWPLHAFYSLDNGKVWLRHVCLPGSAEDIELSDRDWYYITNLVNERLGL